MATCDIGIVGLGVMGENLALNITEKGYKVAIYNRTAERTKRFYERYGGSGSIAASYSPNEFVSLLQRPRRIAILVKAGPPLDEVLDSITPFLERGDVITDMGNSHFRDTELRMEKLSARGILYNGIGVSGGQEGARHGACFMAGGPEDGYEHLSQILDASAAKTEDGPACAYLGPRGAGHYVKMVHNGIEYAMIQALAECYDIMKIGLSFSNQEISDTFSEWAKSELASFLVEASARVSGRIDHQTGKPMLELIVDRAEQKGTGKWCSQDALELGIPTPTIDAAVAQRSLSGFKDLRIRISSLHPTPVIRRTHNGQIIDELRNSLFCTFLTAFAQGFSQMREASEAYSYHLQLTEIARIWKGGCIIRARMIDTIKKAFEADKLLPHLFLDHNVSSMLKNREDGWRRTITLAKNLHIPVPAMSTALDYYDSIRRERLPASLIQALRDLFGAHGVERVDKQGHFHINW